MPHKEIAFERAFFLFSIKLKYLYLEILHVSDVSIEAINEKLSIIETNLGKVYKNINNWGEFIKTGFTKSIYS